MDIDVGIVGAGASGLAAARVVADAGAALSWRLFGTGERPPGIPTESYEQRPVTSVLAMGSSFTLLRGTDMIDAEAVIIASGTERIPPIIGERALRGRGVSYCAACDGDLFRGKRIAAVLPDPSALHELELLAARAADVLVFTDAHTVLPPGVRRAAASLSEIVGERVVEHLRLADGSRENVSAVFVLKSELAPEVLVPGIELAEDDRIRAAPDGSTNLAGLFAAGSVTGGAFDRGRATGGGAANSALRLLALTRATAATSSS